MTGIVEMFAELSGDNHDWFQMAFAFEQTHYRAVLRERENYRRIKATPDRYAHRLAYKREWIRNYHQQKRADPIWLAEFRRKKREQARRYRERKRQESACP